MKKINSKDIILFLKKKRKNNKKIDLNISLIDQKILDSMDVLELIDFLEIKTKKKINFSKITKQNFGSVNLMVKYVNKL